jgi:hypothetical protein
VVAMTTPHLRIELDVFSGRANPSWILDRAESEALLTRLRVGRPCVPRPDRLGYRGFLVWQIGRQAAEPWLRVGHGIITPTGLGAVSRLDDGGLEEFLIEQAAARGFASLIDRSRPQGEEA